MKRESDSTKSSETTSYRLVRVETQVSTQTTDTNGAPLSPISPSDQAPETFQEASEEGYKDSYEQGDDYVDLERMAVSDRRMKAASKSVRNGRVSRPVEPEMREVRDASGPGRSLFRPSPESWANATTEALDHLKAIGVIPQVPEVPHFAPSSSPPTIGVTSPSPIPPSRVAEVEISASSPFKRVAPGVSLYSPSPTEDNGLSPLSKRFQPQRSSRPVRHYLPESHSSTPSDRLSELPHGRIREQNQMHQNRIVAIYSPTGSSSDHLAEHEGDGDQKPASSRVQTRPYRAERDPEYSTIRQLDPFGDQRRYAARSPIPGSTGGNPHLTATRAHEKQESLDTDEVALNVTRYAFPDVPSHKPSYLPPAPQHTPQNYRRQEPVALMEEGVHQSQRNYEPRRDNYPLSQPPPYRISQSPGRVPIDSGASYRSQRPRTEQDFPTAPRDDPRVYGMSSPPLSSPPSAIHPPYRTQSPQVSQAARVRRGEDHGFLRSPLSSESLRTPPEIDLTHPANYYGDGVNTNRRPSAIADDTLQDRQPSSAGYSSGFKRPNADHVDYHPRGFQTKLRNLPPMPLETPPPPVPPIPLSHRPDERGSHYPGTLEPGHFHAVDDHSSNYSSRPSIRSSIATSVATPYDVTSAASTVRSPSRLSTVYDPQDELHDRKLDFVSVHAHRTEDDQIFYSDVLDEYRDHTPDSGLFKTRGRDTVFEAAGALNSARSRTPVSDRSSSLAQGRGSSSIITPLFKEKFNGIDVPRTVVIPPVQATGSLTMANAEEEAPLHVDELNVPSRKPLSKMEKALVRRVEFGTNMDYSRIQLT
jgi:hypothetical protein